MKIQFLGAAKMVTGSCYLCEVGNLKFLIDCGMFQGLEVEELNWHDFSFKPKDISCVILTHSHLDHSGLLPKLYKKGFSGKVHMTYATRHILEHMLLDSAKVQEIRSIERKEIKVEGKKAKLAFSFNPLYFKTLIYDTKDVLGLLRNTEEHHFGEEFKINDNVKVKFIRAGHVLGAASIVLEVSEDMGKKTLIFSGDLGNTEQYLDTRIDFPKFANFVIMESLYGDEEHPERDAGEKEFKDLINRTLAKGGNVVIPSFSLQRSQEMLYLFSEFIKKDEIPRNTRVFLDSPLSITLTDIYKQLYKELNYEVIKKLKSGNELFNISNIEYVTKHKRSLKIGKKRGVIIIAGNGMCMGGRILYHLVQNLPDKRSSIAFVGYQAEGTLGKEIVDGANEVLIEGIKIKIRSNISYFPTFSAHADCKDLLSWISGVKKSTLKRIFLTHTNEPDARVFKNLLEGRGYKDIIIPGYKEAVEV